jgi:molybdopterin-containing oxidoreductase family iron-sulfur binding subunit
MEEKRNEQVSAGEQFWRSLNELEQSPEFEALLQQEFPRQAAPLGNFVSRRQFLRLMGASMALAGLSACGYKPQGPIISRPKTPEDRLTGISHYYATAVLTNGYGFGVLGRVYEGRPVKLEGNPDHPTSLGATDAIVQAQILDLYDPDRSQNVLRFGRIETWRAFEADIQNALAQQAAKGGAGIRILTGRVVSPTLAAQIRKFLQTYPQAKWYQYEPINRDNVYEGARLAFGEWLNPIYRLRNAKVIVALDSDFLYTEPGAVRYAREFADGRRIREGQTEMNRLYVAEPMFTVTGMTADERLPIRSSRIARLLYEIAKLVGAPVQATVEGELTETEQKWAQVAAGDLVEHRGQSLVIVGEAQPPAVHAMAHAINAHLGNLGKTVVFTAPPEEQPVLHQEQIRQLAQDLANNAVEVLIMLGGVNPAYNAPVDLKFGELIPKVPLSVHHGMYVDETAALCVWHLPESHPFEAWGDVRAFDGTVTIQQPLIYPLYPNTRTALEVMALLNGAPAETFKLVQDHWKQAKLAPEAQFDAVWRKGVHDGVLPRTAKPVKQVALKQTPLVVQSPIYDLAPVQAGVKTYEVRFAPDPTVYDGRFANNAWLQELPKPVTRVCWDNLAYMSLKTFEELGLRRKGTWAFFEDASFVQGDAPIVTLSVNGYAMRVAAYPIPGHADDCITLHLGYGRTRAGEKGSGTGFNAYLLRTSDAPWIRTGVEVIPQPERYPIARTEEHHLIDTRQKNGITLDSTDHRPIILTGSLEEFKKDPELKDKPHRKGYERMHPSMYPERWQYERYENPDNYRYAWAMVIDPTVCTGCSACVTACQAENNIPVVGKTEVMRGREMLWLRIDRYFKGKVENPRVYQVPIPCMQCENAPCEVVCPVAATVHDHEGLNVMVYNRCVGTRYCSNNCPYKVRRFNFYRYSYMKSPVLHLLQNPDVTVRGRGVMEKCTYCVQRISKARIAAKRENRPIRDGEVVPACQQACPTQAIVFGNLNDPNARVTQLRKQPHNFSILGELNTRPRTTYLAKIDNPHPELSGVEADHATDH